MKGLIAKHFKKIFSFYGNLIRECFNEKFLMVWKFCKKQFSKGE